MSKNENWKSIPNFDKYEINEEGLIRNKKMKTPVFVKHGTVRLYNTKGDRISINVNNLLQALFSIGQGSETKTEIKPVEKETKERKKPVKKKTEKKVKEKKPVKKKKERKPSDKKGNFPPLKKPLKEYSECVQDCVSDKGQQTSEKIRNLFTVCGIEDRSEIAGLLGIRYQHVRNVLTYHYKKGMPILDKKK